MALAFFSWIDYTVFCVITALGCVIGVYFGLYKKQDTVNTYLFGGKNMKWFPVSMSLVSSALSGFSLLGLPTEIYLYGTQVSVMVISIAISGLVNHFVFLPVFYKLQLSSVYEYLELRYNRHLRNAFSLLFITTNLVVLPLLIYVPSLIFSQVSGVHLHVIAPIMILLCIFYTSIGGMKAVVWADTAQFAVTLVTLVTVITLGINSIGSFKAIFDRVQHGRRFEFFNFSLDPTIRSTFWSVLIGHVFNWTGLVTISAPEVQRFLAVPSKADVKKVLIVFTAITILSKVICFLLGLIIYAKYYDCDPKSIGEIRKADQIVPYFITEVTEGLKGLNGLFVASFFGAAFSTYSTVLNTLASVLYTDFAHLFLPKKYMNEKSGITLKVFTLLIGLSSIGLIYLVEHVGTVFEVVYYVKGITGGAVLGIFLMGLTVPSANTRGAIVGGLVSSILMGVIIIRTQLYIWNGVISTSTKPLYTYGCNATESTTFATTTSSSFISVKNVQEEPLWLFRLSFQYYYFIGTMTTIIIGVFVSWITQKKTDAPVNPNYISPFLHKCNLKLQKSKTNFEEQTEPLREKIIP